MPYTYIKVSGDKIVKARPKGYDIVELKDYLVHKWNTYTTSDYTGRTGNSVGEIIPDIVINKDLNSQDITVQNRFDIFIRKKSQKTQLIQEGQETKEILNSINIDSVWDNAFPETIRLKYPGITTSNNFAQRSKYDNETNYSFKVWGNRMGSDLGKTIMMPEDTVPTIDTGDYFYDLLAFIKLDTASSYEEWLRRPMFSLKGLLSKSIAQDGRMYQLYKVDDASAQSMSFEQDEYIPWCFDSKGVKIDQHKVALIHSYNRQELYLLLEIRSADVRYEVSGNTTAVNIPTIDKVVFWRTGILDKDVEYDIRNRDQKVLVDSDGNFVAMSQYFKDSKIKTDVLVNLQRDRLEDDGGYQPPDNDMDTYKYESNVDTGFVEYKSEDAVEPFISGTFNGSELRYKISNLKITDHMKYKVHIFADGKLLDYNKFRITDGVIYTQLSTNTTNIEIFVNRYETPEYSFFLESGYLTNNVINITDGMLSDILYRSGFLWKTHKEKDFILFSYTSTDQGVITDNGVIKDNGDSVNPSSKLMIIIHGLDYDLDNPDTAPITTSIVLKAESGTKHLNDYKNYNINYDPSMIKTDVVGNDVVLDTNISDKDVYIFDNTNNLLKTEGDEPYLKYDSNNKISVMGVVDENIGLTEDQVIKDVKRGIEERGLLNIVLDSTQKDYIKAHYNNTSNMNQSILNMFISANNISNDLNNVSWVRLNKDTLVRNNKDYMIVRYVGDIMFPVVRFHTTLEYNGTKPFVEVNFKPQEIPTSTTRYKFIVLHRNDKIVGNLYYYSFADNVEYTLI